jgi:hypothetical protein
MLRIFNAFRSFVSYIAMSMLPTAPGFWIFFMMWGSAAALRDFSAAAGICKIYWAITLPSLTLTILFALMAEYGNRSK